METSISNGIKALSAETNVELVIRRCLEEIAKDSQHIDNFPKLIALSQQYCAVTNPLGSGPDLQPAEDEGLVLRPHQLCHRCDTDRAEDEGKEEERAFRFEVQICMLRGLQFKLKGRLALWFQALFRCVNDCQDCYKGLWTARSAIGQRYLSSFPQANVDTFIMHTLTWEESQALIELRKGGDISGSALYAMLELAGVLYSRGQPAGLYADLMTARPRLQLDTLPEVSCGILAAALNEDEGVRSWALEQADGIALAVTPTPTFLSVVRILLVQAIERENWQAFEFGRKLDKATWSDAELPNTIVSMITKDVRRSKALLAYLERHLEQHKRSTWNQEDARYPLVILSSILSSNDYMSVICSSTDEPVLFSWMSAILESMLPPHSVMSGAKDTTTARDKIDAFGEALKQIVYFLLERFQQNVVPIATRKAGLERCFIILQDRAIAYKAESSDVEIDSQSQHTRAPFTALQQVISTHSTIIANVAFRGKLPNSSDVVEETAPCRHTALSFVKRIFQLDCETIVERMLEISERSAKQQRAYKRLLKDAQTNVSKADSLRVEVKSAADRFFEDSAKQLIFDYDTSTELWKDSYNACVPRLHVKAFLDPLSVVGSLVNPQINSHIVSVKGSNAELPSYIAYKDALKTVLLGITRRLRAMRGGLPMLLLDLSEDFHSLSIVQADDLPTICFQAADGLLAACLCADADVHKATQNVVRSAFEEAETRADCFRSLLQCNPALALKSVRDVLESFVIAASTLVEANDAAKWLVRSFSDVLEVLCSETDGLLRSGTPFSVVDQKSMHRDLQRLLPPIWMLMCKSIAIIFKRTPSWSKVLPHDQLTAWFRDVILFATEMVTNAELIRSAATIGQHESKDATWKEMESDLALPLEEASSWFRINDLAIVQETRDFFVRGLQSFQDGSSSAMPKVVKDRMLHYIDAQIKIIDDSERTTLLTIAELSQLKALLDPPTSSGASDEDDDFSIVKEDFVRHRPSLDDGQHRTPSVSATARVLEGPSSQEKARLKQAKLSFTPVQSDVAKKQPFVSKPVALPPQPRFPTQTGVTNRYQSAGARPTAQAAPTRPTGKIAQLRQGFEAQRQPTSWKPIPNYRPSSANREQELPQAPEAKRSFNALINMPSAAAMSTSNSAQSKGETDSDSDSSDSDGEDGKVGLANLGGDGKRSPAKLLPKVRASKAHAVRRSAIVLEDRNALQAQRQKEEAERKQKLRQRPNFAPLHRTILSWDYAADGHIPPSGNETSTFHYSTVKSTYANAQDYVATFEPMLFLECWADVQQAREQVSRGGMEHQPTGAKLIGRANIDSFDLLTLTLDPSVRGVQQTIFQDSDVIYVREASAAKGDAEHTFMAKVDAFKHSPKGAQVIVRSCVSKDRRNLSSLMMPGVALHVGKLFSLTTLHREYEALHKLKHYEILSDILFARAAVPEQLSATELSVAQREYGVNEPQARAIVSAIKADKGFHLIQGPPGTGKTKTICSLVAHFIKNRKPPASAIRAGQSGPPVTAGIGGTAVKRKILLCAPSNAAVDEVARRAHQGVRMPNGEWIKPVVVRVGREEAMNVAVKHISLDNMIEDRLASANASGGRSETSAQADPAQISAEIRSLRDQLDLKRAEVENARLTGMATKVIDQLEVEKRNLTARRLTLMEKMDVAKDERQTMNRQKDADRKRIQKEILMQADVICATLGGAGHPTLSSLPFDFETVVIDEAAQAVELDTLIPLRYGCQRCIMVGDPNQLPPTVISREAERMKYAQSLFVRLFDNPNNKSNLLSIQYRMHPYISEFPSRAFYQGKLRDGPNMKQLTHKPWHRDDLLRPFRLFDCRNSFEQASGRGHSLVNRAEAEMAARIYERLRQAESREAGGTMRSNSSLEGNVGVVTMYKDQVRELKRAFRQLYGNDIENAVDFNTVDGFQGQEKDVIILSCVRSNGIGFLNDFRRINVAVTRAKSNLFIVANVGNLEQNDRGGFWQTFITTARKNGDLMPVTSETFRRPYATASSNPVRQPSPPRALIDDGMQDDRQKSAQGSLPSSGLAGTKRQAINEPATGSRNGWKRPRDAGYPPRPIVSRAATNVANHTSLQTVSTAAKPKATPIPIPGQQPTPIAIPGRPQPRPAGQQVPPPRRYGLPARPRPPSNNQSGPSAQASASLFLPKRPRPGNRRQ